MFILQVIFQGIRGRSWQGDIAIDNIEILGCGGEGIELILVWMNLSRRSLIRSAFLYL